MTANREAHLGQLKAQEEQRRLSKAELLTARTREEDIYITGLGGTVTLRSLSHRKRQELRQEAKFNTPEYDDDLFTALCIVESVIDPQLTRDDIEALREQDFVVFDELVNQITMFNLMGMAEALKKGSSETQNSDSPSA